MCLYVPGFQRQVFKHVKILSERLKESKEQKTNKGSVLVAESAYNAQNAQFGLVMLFTGSHIFIFKVTFMKRRSVFILKLLHDGTFVIIICCCIVLHIRMI